MREILEQSSFYFNMQNEQKINDFIYLLQTENINTQFNEQQEEKQQNTPKKQAQLSDYQQTINEQITIRKDQNPKVINSNCQLKQIRKSNNQNVKLFKKLQRSKQNSKYSRQWLKEEDDQLKELVRKYKQKSWSKIAQQIPGRLGKQCRERWLNHLDPQINKESWTENEDLTIMNAHQKYGPKWSIISKFLKGRTDNQIKNHFNSTIMRKIKYQNKSQNITQSILNKKIFNKKKSQQFKFLIFPNISSEQIESIFLKCDSQKTIQNINLILENNSYTIYDSAI